MPRRRLVSASSLCACPLAPQVLDGANRAHQALLELNRGFYASSSFVRVMSRRRWSGSSVRSNGFEQPLSDAQLATFSYFCLRVGDVADLPTAIVKLSDTQLFVRSPATANFTSFFLPTCGRQ